MRPGFFDFGAFCEQAQYNDGYDPLPAEAAFLFENRQNQEPFVGTTGPVLPYNQEVNL